MNDHLVKKAAFLFPGQGVLPADLCGYYMFLKSKNADTTEKYIKILQAGLDEINPQAKFNAKENLANEKADAWNMTSFVQPLTYLLSVLTHELIKGQSLSIAQSVPAFALGHSLGAFSALTASGALDFEQGIKIVAARGKFMQEESEKTDKGMLAILGLTKDKVKEICGKTGCEIALINAPSAFVVVAPRSSFSKIEEEAVSLGSVRTIALATSGAFHTKYMRGTYDKFKEFVKTGFLKQPHVPVVTNIQGIASLDPRELENDVIESIINPINWARMMQFLKNNSVGSFIEVGPGTSLSSLCRLNGVEREQIHHAKELLG